LHATLQSYIDFSPKDCSIQQQPLHVLGDIQYKLVTSLVAPHSCTCFESNVTIFGAPLQSHSGFSFKDRPIQQQRPQIPWGIHYKLGTSLIAPHADAGCKSNVTQKVPPSQSGLARSGLLPQDRPMQRGRAHVLKRRQPLSGTSRGGPGARAGPEGNVSRRDSRVPYCPGHINRLRPRSRIHSRILRRNQNAVSMRYSCGRWRWLTVWVVAYVGWIHSPVNLLY